MIFNGAEEVGEYWQRYPYITNCLQGGINVILNTNEYRSKVLGCWMGKNIGGTLGEPFEWRRQINNVSFYTQDLSGGARPNDDLDLQLAWLKAVEEHGPKVDAKILAEYWLHYITPNWVEYGNSKANLRMGLLPPLSGYYCNPWRDSCGAYIRSEIWACMLPAAPEAAARWAYEDAIVDHGGGEGVYAEAWSAAVESAAFVIDDMWKLIDIGLSVIPKDCGVARAVKLAVKCRQDGLTWLEARAKMLEQLGNYKPGWDVASNIGMLMIGWLYGDGDFGESLCIAVNCGEDTDCTAATLGSILGIILGIDGISEKWKSPIGNRINTLTLNKADGWNIPQTIEELSDRAIRQAKAATVARKVNVCIDDAAPTDLKDLNVERWTAPGKLGDLWSRSAMCIPFGNAICSVILDYGDSPEVRSDSVKRIRLILWRNSPAQQVVRVKLNLPEGWSCEQGSTTAVCLYDNQVTPQPEGTFPKQYKGLLEFDLVSGELTESIYRGSIELTVHDRPSTLYIPLTFINGNNKATQY